ncbi:hypothetical protein P5673_009400 [Acropora cervicornis]|uniref:Proline-rich transmembrane protein 3/4 domain-containing protein n=1 Tax=Acropora cervicornis TaxID=6130 RepID=A0AAD9QSL5_ACRCE|nr:hypothetical protein P5673_009400 [Acropora cervicornis]
MAYENGLSSSADPVAQSEGKASSISVIGEPLPEWHTAIHKWGFAWMFYLYGFGAAFGALSLAVGIFLIRTLKIKRSMRPKKASLILLILLLLFGLFRCLFLCIDAYNIKAIFPKVVSNILWSLGNPCIITGYVLIYLVLRNVFFLREKFQNWYTGRNVALITVPYFLLAFTAELMFFVAPHFKGLTFACQIVTVILSMMLSSFYSYVVYLLWKNYKRKRTGKDTTKIQQMAWAYVKPKNSHQDRKVLSIFKTCIAAVVGGMVLCALQIYSMSGVYGVFSKAVYVKAWPWLIFNYAMRILELFLALVLYAASTTGVRQQTAAKNHNHSFAVSLTVPVDYEGAGSRRGTRLMSLSIASSNAVTDVGNGKADIF